MKVPFNLVLFNPIRLELVDILNEGEQPVSFAELKSYLELTDGNLASHLRALEKAKMISFQKTFEGRRPKTIYSLTLEGKNNLANLKEWLYQNFFEG